jgi:hypothetical protein
VAVAPVTIIARNGGVEIRFDAVCYARLAVLSCEVKVGGAMCASTP